MTPARPPPPTAWNRPFHASPSGSQTSNLIAGSTTPATRHIAGTSRGCPPPGGVNVPAATRSAIVISVSGRSRRARSAHSVCANAGAVMAGAAATSAARIAKASRLVLSVIIFFSPELPDGVLDLPVEESRLRGWYKGAGRSTTGRWPHRSVILDPRTTNPAGGTVRSARKGDSHDGRRQNERRRRARARSAPRRCADRRLQRRHRRAAREPGARQLALVSAHVRRLGVQSARSDRYREREEPSSGMDRL